jgi:RNA polymerase sigma-70 factor (sigma-E family)
MLMATKCGPRSDGVSEDLVRRVYDASYRRLVGQLYGVCGDLAEAEDVVQEAFVRAVSAPRRFARVDNPEAWLRTVAVNLARSRHRRRALGLRLAGHTAGPSVHPPDLTEERVALVEALRLLPAAQREALALHYLADLPVHEVARTLDVPLGTVKARLSRGRTALAALLAEPASRPDRVEEVHRG